jgi:hypothetical protein
MQDEASWWKEDLLTPHQSVLNLLVLLPLLKYSFCHMLYIILSFKRFAQLFYRLQFYWLLVSHHQLFRIFFILFFGSSEHTNVLVCSGLSHSGPPTSGGTKKAAAIKWEKGEKGKGKNGQSTAGEIFVMPFLSQCPLPDDRAVPSSEQVKYVYQLMFPIHGVSSLLQPHKILLASKHCLFGCYAQILT